MIELLVGAVIMAAMAAERSSQDSVGAADSRSNEESGESSTKYQGSSDDNDSPGFFSRLFGGGRSDDYAEEPQTESRSASSVNDIKIVDIGGGNVEATKRVLERISRQQGYGDDLRSGRIKEVKVTNHLRYEDEGGIVPYGTNVGGFYSASEGAIYVETSGDLERRIKHELGHAMKGSPEECAEYYERRHY